MDKDMVVILDNIRSAHNVGSIFRTSDGAGVSRIILCGYTPAPTDRFGRVQGEILKTSLGASEMIKWEAVATEVEITAMIQELKDSGFIVVAVEQTPHAVSLFDFVVPNNVAYIFGNEIDGVSSMLLQLCDAIVEIPMAGQKESLNVSVAAGIVMYH